MKRWFLYKCNRSGSETLAFVVRVGLGTVVAVAVARAIGVQI